MTHPSTQPVSQSVSPLFVGIDVAKNKLDLARSDSAELLTVSNDPQGIRRIVELLQAALPTCIVVEATGGLERPLVDPGAPGDAHLPVAVVNPARVRHLAMGVGILAKTDSIDPGAPGLREFGRLAKPRLAQKRSANQAELDELVTCRRQLTCTRTVQSNCRLTTRGSPGAPGKAIDAVLKILDRQIESLDQKIRQLIDSDDDFKHLDRLLRTVPGVGPVLSATLTAELSELGGADRREIGALVGVAPFNHDSGKFRGKRAIRGGRASVRCPGAPGYMATLAAIRFNPVLRNFAERLAKTGKSSKVIIVACMRKLLTLLNAMVRDNLTWPELRVVKTLDI